MSEALQATTVNAVPHIAALGACSHTFANPFTNAIRVPALKA